MGSYDLRVSRGYRPSRVPLNSVLGMNSIIQFGVSRFQYRMHIFPRTVQKNRFCVDT